MTLPFRRRHHDAEASHDRARAIVAMGFVDPTEPADAAWLESHLAGCPDCRAEAEAYRTDRELLRGLRDRSPEPPRDLWARTAATIERESGRRDRTGRAAHGGRRVARLPLGVLSGVLVVLVVVGTSLVPRGGELPPITTDPVGTDTAVRSTPPEATPLAVSAKALAWVQEQSDGTYQLLFSDVSEVCTEDADACAPIDDASTVRLTLPKAPVSVVLSDQNDQVVVVTAASDTGGGEVIVVPAPTATPTGGPTSTPTAEPTPVITPEPTPIFTLDPGQSPDPTATPDPSATPDPNAPRAIVSGVVVVGEAAYDRTGEWLAFSARPMDGSAGPDLYVWHVGDLEATAVTADHRTFFAGWLDGLILASRVVPATTTDPLASPGPSGSPTAGPSATAAATATAKPGRTPNPGGPGRSASPDTSPETSPEASEAPAEDRAVSFLLDPESGAVLDLAGHDIWRPVVDPTSTSIVYWSGTLVPDESGTGWVPATGQLVLDGWVDPTMPGPTSEPGATDGPGTTPSAAPTATAAGSSGPLATAAPTPPPGPAGTPVVLAEGPVVAFEASFDPTGTRLAVWIGDPDNPTVGALRLIALDAATGAIDPAVDPLPGVAALRGFSIGEGRLAWVTPPGQDGDASHVHVLAWTEDEFGQVRSIAGDRLLVVR